jgi:hypothetical protein
LLLIWKPWRWKWVLVYFKRFEEVKWKTRRSKRLSITSWKRSHLAFWKMVREYYGTEEGFVCLMSRN